MDGGQSCTSVAGLRWARGERHGTRVEQRRRQDALREERGRPVKKDERGERHGTRVKQQGRQDAWGEERGR